MAVVNTTQKLSTAEVPDSRQLPVRSPSAASDITTRSIYLSVPQAYPAPAYVAQHAASELVTNEIGNLVSISSTALNLVNEFLDQVLYNILVASRSISLSSLKSAVSNVLKPRLGKAAIKVAEEELKEYMNDDEELELQTRTDLVELKHDFDADLAWKLARLRCMVYTRLGDLEEEDEEEWLEKEGLLAQLHTAKQSAQATMETGPASAIFLTSVVEYLGEQALYYAAQHAQRRHQNMMSQAGSADIDSTRATMDSDEIVVNGKDMNHVGRDSPLSRLWRSYRRNTRDSGSAPMSPDSRFSYGQAYSHSRGPSTAANDRGTIEEIRSPDQIPLPMSINDVDQIEVPGLAPALSDDENEAPEARTPKKQRPVSMILMPGGFPGSFIEADHNPPEVPQRNPMRPNWMRKRSLSSPVATLAKASASTHSLPQRDDSFLRDYHRDNKVASVPVAEPEKSSPTTEHGVSTSTGVIGGAVTAVASALGIGALGASRSQKSPSQPTLQIGGVDGASDTRSPANVPKKSVAEEMLGVTTSVRPPQDATTGASITNMSDFYSMHVPIAMSPGSSMMQASPTTPLASKDGAYFPTSDKSRDVSPGVIAENLYTTDGTDEKLKPAPLRTTSAREPATRLAPAAGERKAPVVIIDDTTTTPAKERDVEQPISPSSTIGSRPESSGSAIVGTAVSAVPLRGASTQARHVKGDSYSSVNSIHARKQSGDGRVPGQIDQSVGRQSSVPQQRMSGSIGTESRAAPSPSIGNVVQNARHSGSSTNASKRFHGKPLQIGDETDEAKKKSLEILIRGNETLHYTLTPAAALRDEKNRTQSIDASDTLRTISVTAQEPTSYGVSGGSGSNTLDRPASPARLVPRMVTPTSPNMVVSPVSPSRARNPLGEPRPARTETTSSTRDLADYARSTGPLDAKQLPQSIGPRAGLPASPRPTATSPQTSAPAQDPVSPGNRSANRLRYQARDARPNRADDSSDLIDFIREGPPFSGKDAREHRIDRKVAPFRTTMDSEDFDNLAQGRGVGLNMRNSEDGRLVPSEDPSVTSQTPLIVSNKPQVKALKPAAPISQNDMESNGMPKRTRRRVRDPYAIDDSDDEEFQEEQPKRQEESLMDFLRNTAPSAGMTTPPALSVRAGQRSTEASTASGIRDVSPHLTQSGSKLDTYRPTQPTHAAHVEKNRAARSTSPVAKAVKPRPKSRFEARDAKATRTDTAELAEYLKNSGPAPNAQFKPQPFILSSRSSEPTKAQTPPAKEENANPFKRFSKQRKK